MGPDEKIPKGAYMVEQKEQVEGDVKHTDTYYMVPSGEKKTTKKVTEKKAKKYEGIGPTDEGLPIALRQVRNYFTYILTG